MELIKIYQNLNRYTQLTILVILIGTILRFILAYFYPASSDAAWHLNIARDIAENNRIPLFEPLGRFVFSYPFLFYFIAALFYKVFIPFGENAASHSMQFVVPIFATLTLILTYLIVKRLSNEKIAFYSILFMTFIPVHFYHSYISFLDMPFAFFVILSVYLALRGNWIWSVIVLGLANNIRIYGLILFPLLAYCIYISSKTRNEFIKKLFFAGLILLIIASPIFIRSYIYLNNPVWPAMVYIFKGSYPIGSWDSSITSSFAPLRLYWGFFGIPNENAANFLLLNIPFIKTFFVLWILATLTFSAPFILGWRHIKSAFSNPVVTGGVRRSVFFDERSWFLFFWSLVSIIPMILFELQVRTMPRHLLPILPIFAFIWALGFNKIEEKISGLKKLKIIWLLMITLIIIGFIGGEIVKTSVAKSWHDTFSPDYKWAKENLPRDALVHYLGQTLSYDIHRYAPRDSNFKSRDYIWLNDNYFVEPPGVWPKNVSQVIKDKYQLIYQNNQTGTEIYKVPSTLLGDNYSVEKFGIWPKNVSQAIKSNNSLVYKDN